MPAAAVRPAPARLPLAQELPRLIAMGAPGAAGLSGADLAAPLGLAAPVACAEGLRAWRRGQAEWSAAAIEGEGGQPGAYSDAAADAVLGCLAEKREAQREQELFEQESVWFP